MSTKSLTYHENFTKSIGGLKVGLIIFFLLVTVVYQRKFKKDKAATTFFGDTKTKPRIYGEAALAGLFGVVSMLYIMASRQSLGLVGKHFKTLVIVFFILALFALAQESSGFNRYQTQDETAKGEGPYAEIEGTKDNPVAQMQYKQRETGGDPFVLSVAYACLGLVMIGVVWNILKMSKYTVQGAISGENSIGDSGAGFGKMSPYLGFLLELLALAVLNSIAPWSAAKVRGEAIDQGKHKTIMFIAFVAVVLHIMLQYTGMLKF
jgi:hypothetical protein